MSSAMNQRPTHGGNLAWAASIAGCSPQEILDFSASINPLGPPQSAIDTMATRLSDLKTYPNPDYPELKQAIAAFHQIPAEWVLPGNGAAELLTWAALEFSQRSETVLPTPAFADYRRALQTFGVRVREVSVWDIDTWTTDLSNTGILINNPHNPTGKLFETSQLLPLLDRFALVLVDEAFMDFLPPAQQSSLIGLVEQFSNLVILRSLTKFYSLPGLRLGYVISQPDRVRRWQKWRDPWAVNALAVAAGIAVLADVEFQDKTLNWLERAKRRFFQDLLEIDRLSPDWGAANFLLVKTEAEVDRLQKQLLQKHRILIRDCLSFPALGNRYFRVAVRRELENQKLIDGIKNIL